MNKETPANSNSSQSAASGSTKETDSKRKSYPNGFDSEQALAKIKTALEQDKTGKKDDEQSEDDEEPQVQGEGMNKKLVTKKPTKHKLILCTSMVRYAVIKKVCRRMDFKLNDSEEADWDLLWTDTGIQPEKFIKLKSH